ncbi:MAG: N-acetyltransferase [Sporomusa sp.]|nr:N-acetyltransferase [Sporomusa sp.]
MAEWKGQEEFPVIETDRLVLRQLLIEDAASLYQYWSDPDVTEYLTLESFANIQEAVAMIELLNGLPASKQGIRWVITRKEDNKVLGTCGFHNVKLEHSRAEIGYELGKEYWGQGVMKESLTAILNYGFNKMKYNRVEAFVNVGNSKSAKILAKRGFRLDGLLREYEFACGKFVDQHCYSLLKSDYELTFKK